jgi:hypothetical protein
VDGDPRPDVRHREDLARRAEDRRREREREQRVDVSEGLGVLYESGGDEYEGQVQGLAFAASVSGHFSPLRACIHRIYSLLISRLTQPNTTEWQQAHRLYTQAFKSPPTPSEQKKLAKILKRPLTDELQKELDKEMFDYDEGFLKGLGKMNLSGFTYFLSLSYI